MLNAYRWRKIEVFAAHFSKVFSNSTNSAFKSSIGFTMNEDSNCPPISLFYRKFMISVGNKLSSPNPITAGTPQGRPFQLFSQYSLMT